MTAARPETTDRINSGREMLSAQGLNLFAILGSDLFPDAFNEAVRQAGIPLDDYASLVLIGHSGNTLWQRLAVSGMDGTDPVDRFSIKHARHFVEAYLERCPHLLLYPGPVPIPLQQLGALAGWHHPSPLGVGVNETHGPWFGYRAVLLVQTLLPVERQPIGRSPCDRCVDKPCVSTCPVQALSSMHQPDITACVEHRLRPGSPCAHQCLARSACPIGAGYRYDDEQIDYFYRRSLQSILEYMDRSR